jgi:hypothetical protein
MALFTDGPISGIGDLTTFDSQLLDVASQESVDVTQKLALAQEEIALELSTMIGSIATTGAYSWVQRRLILDRVVLTAPLKIWHAYHTLKKVYEDVFGSLLNDRYAAKRDQFRNLADAARERLRRTGIGVTTSPVPKATIPQLVAVPGSLADGRYCVTMSWVNQRGEEGASADVGVIVVSGSTFQIVPAPPPESAAGWNVYVGGTPQTMVIQNVAAVASNQMWTQPSTVALSGKSPSTGQEPTYMITLPRVIQRG